MPTFGKALLAIVFSFLIPGAGLVYSGRALLGSAFAVGTTVVATLGIFLPAFFPPAAAAWVYNVLLLVTAGAWLAQFVLTLQMALVLRRDDSIETKLPMAVAVIFVTTAVFIAFGGLRGSYGVAPFVVPTGSMKPTLQPGDRILAMPFPSTAKGEFFRGKTIMHRVTSEQNPEGTIFLKRVVAVAGDVVALAEDCSFLVNGKPVPPPGPSGDPKIEIRCTPVNVTLAPQTLFLVGDNRENSSDSRHQGPVKESDVVGRPYTIWFSRSPGGPFHWNRIGNAIE